MGEQNNNNNPKYRDNTSLEYKNHDEFFDKFYTLRTDLITSIALCNDYLSNNNPKLPSQMNYTITALDTFIIWSYSQLKRGGMDEKQLNKDLNLIRKEILSKDYGRAYDNIKNIFTQVSEIHEKTELIPRINVTENENEKFWRDEDNKAMKEIKKAFYDVLLIE